MTEETRPVPRLLIWGLIGGLVVFAIILVMIVEGRDRGVPAPAQSSESKSASPPQ